jgi:parallel beta-helix repeat protein
MCVTALVLVLSSALASASTWHVATTGNDANGGSDSSPFLTIQRAVTAAQPGDTVIVHPGTYLGFKVSIHATAAAPITFKADGTVNINGAATTDRDAIHVEGSSYVTIDGFTVTGAGRAGISALDSDHITVRNNRVDANTRWGVFSSFCDDFVVEHNRISNSGSEHGVYASNSADRPIVRFNEIWGNGMCGVHMNGDINFGGDGLISNAIVESNYIHDNGLKGGSAINGDGVANATIRNNVLDNNHASGISLYQIDGGSPSNNNSIVNNTIRMASGSRSGINIQDGATGNQIRNNIVIDETAGKGVVDVCTGCTVVSNHNIFIGKFIINGSAMDITAWRTRTGNDQVSIVATAAQLFTSATDMTLRAGSPAIDAGNATGAPSVDFNGTARPQGNGVDIGAYERCEGSCVGGNTDGGDDGTGTGTGSDTTDTGSDGPDYSGTGTDDGSSVEDPSGGCAAGGGSPGLFVSLIGLFAVSRRFRRLT